MYNIKFGWFIQLCHIFKFAFLLPTNLSSFDINNSVAKIRHKSNILTDIVRYLLVTIRRGWRPFNMQPFSSPKFSVSASIHGRCLENLKLYLLFRARSHPRNSVRRSITFYSGLRDERRNGDRSDSIAWHATKLLQIDYTVIASTSGRTEWCKGLHVLLLECCQR